jgi:hypothetical protein
VIILHLVVLFIACIRFVEVVGAQAYPMVEIKTILESGGDDNLPHVFLQADA